MRRNAFAQLAPLLALQLITLIAATCLVFKARPHTLVTNATAGHPGRLAGIDKGPYLMSATQTSVVVCWVSDMAVTGTVSVAGANSVADAMPAIYHRVKLTGLKPYTRYNYTVTCAGQSKSGRFITAAPKNQPFTFVAYGDNRTQPAVHASVLARIGMFNPDFIVQTGDQVANGANQLQWDEFWSTVGSAFSQTVYYPCLGNHERHGAPYFLYFAVAPEYSFDYGNAHFVALDSNRPAAEYADQEKWLSTDLAAHQQATWRIVYFHHTVHTCVDIPGRRTESLERAKRLEPVLAAGNVQLVINGHDHDYQRHVAHGITYIVTGGGGAPLYDVTPDTPFVKMAKKVHHHCEFSVTGNTIAVRAVEPDGQVIEQFRIQSNGS